MNKDLIMYGIMTIVLAMLGFVLYTTYNTNKIVTSIQNDYEFYID